MAVMTLSTVVVMSDADIRSREHRAYPAVPR